MATKLQPYEVQVVFTDGDVANYKGVRSMRFDDKCKCFKLMCSEYEFMIVLQRERVKIIRVGENIV